MPAIQYNPIQLAIQNSPLSTHPYRHLVVENILPSEAAAELVDWFRHKSTWWQQERDFYVHDSCDNLDDCPQAVDGALSPDVRAGMAEALSTRFGIELDTRHVSLCAHRMRKGHMIGVHTDDPRLGSEAFRLLITLGDEMYHDSFGGHFCMLSDNDIASVAAIARPLHNFGLAFELSETSYHAVNRVKSGERFSLVFGFWRADQIRPAVKRPAGRRIFSPESIADMPGIDPVLMVLRDRGAERISHSGTSLFDHLIGVAAILHDWQCDRPTCLAGLLHSVYGTATFHQRLFAEWERSEISALVGEEAEMLVWLFSVVRFNEIYRYKGEQGYLARRRDATSPVELSLKQVASLNLIALANALEQDDAPFEPGSRFEIQRAFEKIDDLVPLRAKQAVRELVG